jgi:hypothetical protein
MFIALYCHQQAALGSLGPKGITVTIKHSSPAGSACCCLGVSCLRVALLLLLVPLLVLLVMLLLSACCLKVCCLISSTPVCRVC